MSMDLYRVEVAGRRDDLGFPVELDQAIGQVRRRAPLEPFGDALRIVRIRYRLDPAEPPSQHTPAAREVWRGTVLRFPDIGSLGVYVCKPDSQHRFGNAEDWAAAVGLEGDALSAYLWGVFDWQLLQAKKYERTDGAEGLPIAELIFRDVIATRARDWVRRPYTGTFHAAHVHSSDYPLVLPYDRPCGAP